MWFGQPSASNILVPFPVIVKSSSLKKIDVQVDKVENTMTCCKVAKAKSRTANRYDGQTKVKRRLCFLTLKKGRNYDKSTSGFSYN